MRNLWQIFKKDVRRFWLLSLLTWLLLTWLVFLDASRSGYTPNSMEGWLNVLLPFAWVYLIALVITEDSPVGHRQFWFALPCHWASLVAGKILFIACVIHIPYFIGTALIVAARGFNPILFIPQLLAIQGVLLVAITLPGAALAALVRNVIQFVVATLALIAVFLLVNNGRVEPIPPWMPPDYVRNGSALLVAAIAALLILYVQYRTRSTALARFIGAIMASAAVLVYLYLPRETAAAIRCGMGNSEHASLGLVVKPGSSVPDMPRLSPSAVQLAIPLELSRSFDLSLVRTDPISLTLERPDAPPIKATLPSPRQAVDKTGVRAIFFPGNGHFWQVLSMSPAVFKEFAQVPTTLRGITLFEFSHRTPAVATLPIGTRAFVPGTGYCESSILDLSSSANEDLLEIRCESLSVAVRYVRVSLTDSDGHAWRQSLGDSYTNLQYPGNAWLSPMVRRNTVFHLRKSDDLKQAGSEWLVPKEAVAKARLIFSAEPQDACALVRFEIRNVSLSSYLN